MKMVKWWNHDMMKWSNSESIFGVHLHWWWYVEMVKKKSNGTMDCVVIFNRCLSYQISFSLLDFHSSYQWWWYWRLWRKSTMLYLASAGLPSILSCKIYILLQFKSGVLVIWFPMVQQLWCDYFVAGILQSAVVGLNFVLQETSRGTFPGAFSRIFNRSGQLSGHKLTQEMSWDRIVLMYL